MRTLTHVAIEYDTMDRVYGTFIECECGKRAVTRDEIARKHQTSKRVIPGVYEIED